MQDRSNSEGKVFRVIGEFEIAASSNGITFLMTHSLEQFSIRDALMLLVLLHRVIVPFGDPDLLSNVLSSVQISGEASYRSRYFSFPCAAI